MKIDRVNSVEAVQTIEKKIDSVKASETKSADEIDVSQLDKAIDTLNKKAEKNHYDVRFSVYKDSNRIVIEVVDKTNDQVISTFPPKQILEMALMVDKEFKVLDKKI
ncbi:flagellar protein FlaG [Pelosinus propionicus]|uniref:Flagellar protein FlaG n=1 Tax=Pelosinus propionicus DSM 13327 TaxID=1123291 RepID=A0A1I4HRX4_9FIRM|nr:flagellar protein FlaG [Pelosinus propionicus]SFL44989.1 flagellar protein FlaG [Pelosinus propionicus DSM 13327]